MKGNMEVKMSVGCNEGINQERLVTCMKQTKSIVTIGQGNEGGGGWKLHANTVFIITVGEFPRSMLYTRVISIVTAAAAAAATATATTTTAHEL